jgi:hypothetical protein
MLNLYKDILNKYALEGFGDFRIGEEIRSVNMQANFW